MVDLRLDLIDFYKLAFPKAKSGRAIMENAPADAEGDTLKELGIRSE